MQFEVIRKSHKKEITIGISLLIILGVVLIARFTFAKYELVKSIKIAEGTINYKVPDFKIMAMYKQKEGSTCTEDSCYDELEEEERMSSNGYAINETKSYCTLDNINKDTKAKLYTNTNGQHIFENLAKSDKCYVYFDKKEEKINGSEELIANITINYRSPDFSDTATTDEGVYAAQDNDGISFYFRGAVANNYVKFADKWWRIIRINGDGSIRLIYDGTSAHANGTRTNDSIAVEKQTFNASKNDNMYVGFKYTSGQVHGLGTPSNALTHLETWYTNNLLSYASKIDTNAGFCGDRTPSTSMSTSNGSGGTGTTTTYYGAYIRLETNKSPVLTCENTSDLYTISMSTKGNKSLTYPIGLISADEVSMAGGVMNIVNSNYYLYNGQEYWTMTPGSTDGAFIIYNFGHLLRRYVDYQFGIRPVINLRSDTKFTFTGTGKKGTMSNPYIVS